MCPMCPTMGLSSCQTSDHLPTGDVTNEADADNDDDNDGAISCYVILCLHHSTHYLPYLVCIITS